MGYTKNLLNAINWTDSSGTTSFQKFNLRKLPQSLDRRLKTFPNPLCSFPSNFYQSLMVIPDHHCSNLVGWTYLVTCPYSPYKKNTFSLYSTLCYLSWTKIQKTVLNHHLSLLDNFSMHSSENSVFFLSIQSFDHWPHPPTTQHLVLTIWPWNISFLLRFLHGFRDKRTFLTWYL